MTRNEKINKIAAFFSFNLSSLFIFNPVSKAENALISMLTAFIAAFFCILAIIHISGRKGELSRNYGKIISVTAALLATACNLILITEIIRDVSFVADRGVSLIYYCFISIAILSVSLYLCLSGEKGIFRFLILSSFLFIFHIFFSLSGFATVKSFVFEKASLFTGIMPSVAYGLLTGLFFSADTSVFIFCFSDFFCFKGSKADKKALLTAFSLSCFMLLLYNLTYLFIFGPKLVKSFSNPEYAAAKLLPFMDFTEMISSVRIVAFLIKSSVYASCAARLCSRAFNNLNFSQKKSIIAQYISLPILVVVLILIDKHLEYGAFQHFIFPIVIILSALFLFIFSFYEKKR